jgi:hypothetical protein
LEAIARTLQKKALLVYALVYVFFLDYTGIWRTKSDNKESTLLFNNNILWNTLDNFGHWIGGHPLRQKPKRAIDRNGFFLLWRPTPHQTPHE